MRILIILFSVHLCLFISCKTNKKAQNIVSVRSDKILDFTNSIDIDEEINCSLAMVEIDTFVINKDLLNQNKVDTFCLSQLKFFQPFLDFEKIVNNQKGHRKYFTIDLITTSANIKSYQVQYGWSDLDGLYDEQLVYLLNAISGIVTSIVKVAEYQNYQGSGYTIETKKKGHKYIVESKSHSDAVSLPSIVDKEEVEYSIFEIDVNGLINIIE